ncbi:MAG TPA: hypothetical protein VFF52_11900 [Isosphaeraceae bacterium]|nr:hypothetical protein [Isosphaeraceae bacterium]
MADDPAAGEDRPSTFEVWKEYESVAVHFNDLIMRLRVQALGGVAALAAVAGIVMNGSGPGRMRWTLMAVASAVLILFWLAVFCLDYFYYTRLLYGDTDREIRANFDRLVRATRTVVDPGVSF